MAWRPHARVKVDARSPRACGVCDRCGIPTNHYNLRWQFDWTGLRLQNLRLLVCARCEDLPQRQLGAKILSPDPLPIFNARPEPFTTTGFGYEQSNVMCQPNGGNLKLNGNGDLELNSGGGIFLNSAMPQGLDGDGPQMTMPDGRLMLMPDNPNGELPLQLNDGDNLKLNSGGDIFLNNGGNE